MLIKSKLQFIEIEKVELFNNLTGSGAAQLRDYLNDCVNEGRYCQLIDFKRVDDIDDVGANLLVGVNYLALFMALYNVKPKILESLKRLEPANNIKIFEESDYSKIVSSIKEYLLTNLADRPTILPAN